MTPDVSEKEINASIRNFSLYQVMRLQLLIRGKIAGKQETLTA